MCYYYIAKSFIYLRYLLIWNRRFRFINITKNTNGYRMSSFSDAAYLHHWLSVTIHFNRYNLCFDKYTECRDKCKSLYFIVLHMRVVPPSFSPFVECPLSDARCWTIGHFRMDVTERLLNARVMFFLEFLWFAVCFFLFKKVLDGRK